MHNTLAHEQMTDGCSNFKWADAKMGIQFYTKLSDGCTVLHKTVRWAYSSTQNCQMGMSDGYTVLHKTLRWA